MLELDLGTIFSELDQEMDRVVELPHKFSPRPYQAPVLDKLLTDEVKRAILIWHRRAGKDKTVWNTMIAKSQERPGLYLYMLPQLNQARKVIWDARGKDGIKFLDHIPKVMIHKKNESQMKIELVNGSIIQLCGSDSYDSLMGTNPLGIVFSEYSIQDPRAWDYFRPILAENGGWAIFDYTPRGKNHGWFLFDHNKDNPKWLTSLLTVRDTKDENGNPVVTEESIQDEIDSGMDPDMVNQEFYCSFEAAIQGAYWGAQLNDAYSEGRVGNIPIEQHLPCYTFWDLGINDYMSIWIMQPHGKEIRLVEYYENSGEGMTHYVNYLKAFAEKHKVRFEGHYAPHDIEVREMFNGLSRRENAYQMGINFQVVPRVKGKADSINAVRMLFPRFYIDKARCERGLMAIAEYQKEWDEKAKMWKDKPLHNWASNGADALQTLGLVWQDKLAVTRQESRPQRHRAGVAGWMQA